MRGLWASLWASLRGRGAAFTTGCEADPTTYCQLWPKKGVWERGAGPAVGGVLGRSLGRLRAGAPGLEVSPRSHGRFREGGLCCSSFSAFPLVCPPATAASRSAGSMAHGGSVCLSPHRTWARGRHADPAALLQLLTRLSPARLRVHLTPLSRRRGGSW